MINIMISRKDAILLILILATTFLTFSPSLFNDYLNWDDTTHYLENPFIKPFNAQNLINVFTTDVNHTYIPFTELSFAIENLFFGTNPFVSHLINVFLHVAVTGLVFLCAISLNFSARVGLIAALLFGIHPLHVESVTWVTGRKDVLYSFFYLLAMYWYLRWMSTTNRKYFVCSLLAGILSILAKPMALSLPLTLIVCDIYINRKLSLLLFWEKLPYFLYVIPIAWCTYLFNSRVINFQWPESFLTWIWCLVFYIKKFIFPLSLNPLYILPQPVSLCHQEYLSAIILVAVTLYLWWRNKNNYILSFALFYYLASMFFLFRFDAKADVHIVADRFMYLASFGFCLFIADTALAVLRRENKGWMRNILAVIFILVIVFFGVKTVIQQFVWKDSITLWSAVIQENPHSFLALTNRANAYLKWQQSDLAIKDLEQSLRINATQSLAFYNLAQAYHQKKDYLLAIENYSKSMVLDPEFGKNYLFRGNIFAEMGDDGRAIEDFTKASRLMFSDASIFNNRGNSFMKVKDLNQALKDYAWAIKLRPDYALAYFNRGNVYLMLGQYENALADILKAKTLGYEVSARNIDFLKSKISQ